MVRFENALDVRPLEDGINWLVLEDFYYDTNITLSGPSPHRIAVLRGFQTDFASKPWLSWLLLKGPAEGRERKIAVVHDALYRTKGLATKREADDVFFEGMTFSRVALWRKWLIYLGVRVGGSTSYKGGLK